MPDQTKLKPWGAVMSVVTSIALVLTDLGQVTASLGLRFLICIMGTKIIPASVAHDETQMTWSHKALSTVPGAYTLI